MGIAAARVAVTPDATVLLSAGAEGDFTPGRSIAVYNPGSVSVYLGGGDVDASTGFELLGGRTFAADLHGDALYGLSASDHHDVHVIQIGV